MATTQSRQSEQHLSPDDPRVARPIFTLREAAGYLGVPKSTVHQWARPSAGKSPLIAVFPRHGREATVPFLGFAEAYVLSTFRKAGLPLQRIRPAVEVLSREIGIDHALASERLYTDGAEVLFDYASERRDDELLELVAPRTGQYQFSELHASRRRRASIHDGHRGLHSRDPSPVAIASARGRTPSYRPEAPAPSCTATPIGNLPSRVARPRGFEPLTFGSVGQLGRARFGSGKPNSGPQRRPKSPTRQNRSLFDRPWRLALHMRRSLRANRSGLVGAAFDRRRAIALRARSSSVATRGPTRTRAPVGWRAQPWA
jgi:hypothetical protein